MRFRVYRVTQSRPLSNIIQYVHRVVLATRKWSFIFSDLFYKQGRFALMQKRQNYHIDALFVLIFVVTTYALIEIGFRECTCIESQVALPDAQ